MSVARAPQLGWRPALDGVRAVAVLLVMAFHFQTQRFVPGGFVGVDLFFVLSGFLITTLLLEERATSGRIALGAFYLRRALRLLPALFATLAGVFFVTLVVLDPSFEARPEPEACLWTLVYALTYVFNWAVALDVSHVPSLVHLWSLSIEEQYYLLWPGLLALLLARETSARTLLALTAGLFLASALIPFVWWDWTWKRLYYASDYRAHALLAGSLLAQLRLHGKTPERLASNPVFLASVVLSAGGLLTVALLARLQAPLLYLGGFPAIALASAVIVLYAALAPASSPPARLLSSRPLVWLGRRSYAVYLWHLPVADWFYWLELSTLDQAVLATALTFALAELSYRLVEQPALQLKHRLRLRTTGALA